MSGCGCGCGSGSGSPYSKGRELVEFVYNAHGGAVRDELIMNGPLEIVCKECSTPFSLETYVGKCPDCGGVYAVAPMSPTVENVQYAGKGFLLP
jgi:hypothetical protein